MKTKATSLCKDCGAVVSHYVHLCKSCWVERSKKSSTRDKNAKIGQYERAKLLWDSSKTTKENALLLGVSYYAARHYKARLLLDSPDNRWQGVGTVPSRLPKDFKKWHCHNGKKRADGSCPWNGSYHGARYRCNNPSIPAYRYYGAKGIKFLMTHADFYFLWERDKAYLLKRPSIDRIDPKGHYELSNCRFIELSENSRRAHKKGAQIVE